MPRLSIILLLMAVVATGVLVGGSDAGRPAEALLTGTPNCVSETTTVVAPNDDIVGEIVEIGCAPLERTTLSIVKSAVPTKVAVGAKIKWTITIKNTGDGTAKNVKFKDVDLAGFIKESLVTDCKITGDETKDGGAAKAYLLGLTALKDATAALAKGASWKIDVECTVAQKADDKVLANTSRATADNCSNCRNDSPYASAWVLVGDPKTILVSAFTPFNGAKTNITQDIVNELKKEQLEGKKIKGFTICTVVIDVVWGEPAKQLPKAIKACEPEAIIELGQCGGTKIKVEKVARNQVVWDDPDFTDNNDQTARQAGRPKTGTADGKDVTHVVAGDGFGATHNSTLPVAEIVAELNKKGAVAESSDDPGRFLCEEDFYTTMRLVTAPTKTPGADKVKAAGFVHIPPGAQDARVKQVKKVIETTIDEKLGP